MGDKIRVGLIYGGKSGEHEVSLQTAFAVLQSFDFSKYDVLPIYITKTGSWRKGPYLDAPVETKTQLLLKTDKSETKKQSEQARISSLPSPTMPQQLQIFDFNSEENSKITGDVDVIFPLLHGTNGEDGTIQGLLEMANTPYVGAGVLSSAMGMDKTIMKKIFAHEGLPQCIYRYFTKHQWKKDQSYYLMDTEVAIGYPCFVKPANLGSSVGISKANDREELIEAIGEAFKYDHKVIIEEFIEAREIEVGVLGNEEPEVSVVGEIVSSNDFYDYKAKYVDGESVMTIPAEVEAETAEYIQKLAMKAFQAIEGTGLSRVDFFIDKTDGSIFINEINTMPGFTPYSMFPLLWKHTGVSYQELLDRLIELAILRYNEKQNLQYGFDAE
ncbi:D-alanine--D-alanine ligase [Chengkuizengella axinellae]|uniref:D-alanine--D-alanine ligase n=1 Tax=Chengkuizengella axinellae TaxID=3064388 RepID=A0ABT9J0A1_9BACL|nr:D-alanine--D-alanine ligase [Chengkuizengella sp. 2205SS18-9]MDP5275007.1 D-alanine--D-alanine ligase [Chengkuizengella sp. 2205SS18-9]